MDSIQAIKGLSPHMGNVEHLAIYINGSRLDAILAEKADKSFLGLIPAWLDYYDESYEPSRKEKEYVWQQTKLESSTKVLPILLCPDDFDFSCTTIVVEVIDDKGTVIWNRFGVDITRYQADETELPKYIGKEVRWFSNVEPFVFSKTDYRNVIEAFLSSDTKSPHFGKNL